MQIFWYSLLIPDKFLFELERFPFSVSSVFSVCTTHHIKKELTSTPQMYTKKDKTDSLVCSVVRVVKTHYECFVWSSIHYHFDKKNLCNTIIASNNASDDDELLYLSTAHLYNPLKFLSPFTIVQLNETNYMLFSFRIFSYLLIA